MKKLLLATLLFVGVINIVNAQWICEKFYWGDKYAYNTSKGGKAFLCVKEYYERETFLGTIAFIPLEFIEKPVYDNGNYIRPEYMLDKKYITLSFWVDGVEKKYTVEANQTNDFSSPNETESYELMISRTDKPLFWYDFKNSQKLYIVLPTGEQYEFNMGESLKAYSHVTNGKTPAWDSSSR